MKAPARRASWHDAYDAQMALWRWYRTSTGFHWLNEQRAASLDDITDPELQGTFNDLYTAEWSRLLDLDPIFVSREMCEVIAAASQTFAPEPPLETDLITPRGFMYWEQPFVISDRWGKDMTLAACSWTRIFTAPDEETRNRFLEAADAAALPRLGGNQEETGTGASVTFAVAEGSVFAAMDNVVEEVGVEGIEPFGIALTLYALTDHEKLVGWVRDEAEAGRFPPIVPVHSTPWYFGMSLEGNEVTQAGTASGAESWWRIVQTSFRLMQQRIAHHSFVRPDRAARRETKRLGLERDPEIVVVRLRREASEGHEPSGEEANYSHRFIVSGHWRNQWYPSDKLHRQIWISPYVKGPEDKPLVVRPRRVYQWNR